MARAALGAKERFPRPGVADDDARWLDAGFVVAGGAEGVDEGGDVGNLVVGQRELRHAGTAGAHHRRDQLAMLIVEHGARSEQARAAVAATGVGAVAELAVDAVERLAALDRGRIGRRPIRIVTPLCADAPRGHNDQRGNRRTRRDPSRSAGSRLRSAPYASSFGEARRSAFGAKAAALYVVSHRETIS